MADKIGEYDHMTDVDRMIQEELDNATVDENGDALWLDSTLYDIPPGGRACSEVYPGDVYRDNATIHPSELRNLRRQVPGASDNCLFKEFTREQFKEIFLFMNDIIEREIDGPQETLAFNYAERLEKLLIKMFNNGGGE